MSIALSIAASGLAASSLRLDVSASNIANALSFGPLPTATNDAGFPPAYIPLRVDQTETAGGGTAPKAPTAPATPAPEAPPTSPAPTPGAPTPTPPPSAAPASPAPPPPPAATPAPADTTAGKKP